VIQEQSPLGWLDELVDIIAFAGQMGEVPRILAARLQTRLIKLAIYRHAGWSGWEAERYLARYGVHTYGRGFDKTQLYLWLNDQQVNFGEYLLMRMCAPVATIWNPANLHAWGKGWVPDWGRPLPPNDLFGWICHWLDRITGKDAIDSISRKFAGIEPLLPRSWIPKKGQLRRPTTHEDLLGWIDKAVDRLIALERELSPIGG
jgi:hypothetical protein